MVLPHPCVCQQLPDSRSHSKLERSSKQNYLGFLCELISSISAKSVLTVMALRGVLRYPLSCVHGVTHLNCSHSTRREKHVH
ncbi:hypothetical protein BRADI_1g28136v3 [Brachypodium distachyon]|uniref:Uncharacterized protein n=1 Tax=Brachypodium distachyon TaxID=15368 RepID=A0A2K2DLJ2_BRADI|nr:hypothetical protein BRADI_1g28136v3 [Brachypodium distachyon]